MVVLEDEFGVLNVGEVVDDLGIGYDIGCVWCVVGD